MGFSPMAPSHRHRTGNARRQWAWLPSDCTSSPLLVAVASVLRLPTARALQVYHAEVRSILFHVELPRDHPSPVATCLVQRAPDEPIVQSPTKPNAMETQSHATSQSASLSAQAAGSGQDRKSTRLNSSHVAISYAVFCLKKKN